MYFENNITAMRPASHSHRRRYELAKGPTQSTTWRRALKKLAGGLAGLALACGAPSIVWADWTPPESSVTPPAVVTLDAFAAPYWSSGANPSAALVVGPDGALYGSAQYGGTNAFEGVSCGTLFRVETNGTFTKLHDFDATDGSIHQWRW
jgi:uncharacterized repeat protein (TIGR03803 family)